MATKPTWTFKNQIGTIITTHDATTAVKYRHDDRFVEVTAVAAEQVDETGTAKAYDAWTNAALEDEIEARNDARGAGEPFVEVEAPGNKAQLVAALQTDDAAQAPPV